jgi:hypothetical protein
MFVLFLHNFLTKVLTEVAAAFRAWRPIRVVCFCFGFPIDWFGFMVVDATFNSASSMSDKEYQTPQSKKRLRSYTSTPGSEVKQQSKIPKPST